MLSLFPQLFTFGLLAPTMLRLTVAVIGLVAGWKMYKSETNLGKISFLIYTILSILLGIGLYTQLVALIGIIVVKFNHWIKGKNTPISREETVLHIVIVIILLSLLFTGPGFLAMDKPL